MKDLFIVTTDPKDLKIFRNTLGWSQKHLKKFGFSGDQMTRIESGKNKKQAEELAKLYNGIIFSLSDRDRELLKNMVYYNLLINRQFPELYGGYTAGFIRKNFKKHIVYGNYTGGYRTYYINPISDECKTINEWEWTNDKHEWICNNESWFDSVVPYLNSMQKEA